MRFASFLILSLLRVTNIDDSGGDYHVQVVQLHRASLCKRPPIYYTSINIYSFTYKRFEFLVYLLNIISKLNRISYKKYKTNF